MGVPGPWRMVGNGGAWIQAALVSEPLCMGAVRVDSHHGHPVGCCLDPVAQGGEGMGHG